MTSRQDFLCLWLVHTSSKQLVSILFEKKMFILKVNFGHMEEPLALLRVTVWWNVSADPVVDNISISRCHARGNQ